MKIAVVLLNWNGVDYLRQFLPTTLAHSKMATLYVIDNGSTDDSIAFLQKMTLVHIIALDQNYGFAEGYNKGLSQIEADIYCLLNTDVRVGQNWLYPIHEHFINNASVGIVQPHILDMNHSDHFEYAGAAGGYIDRLGYAYCRGRIFDHLERDQGQYDTTASIHWASGACFFIRKAVFDSLGGFDASFFAHQEEIDLCWRARNQGYVIHALGQVKVWHVGGGTLAPSPMKTYLNFRNSLALLVKNIPSPLFPKLFFRLLLDGIAGLRFLWQGKSRHLAAVLKAHLHFYQRFPQYWYDRKKNQPTTQPSTILIIYQYFIKKVKKFSALPLHSRIKQ